MQNMDFIFIFLNVIWVLSSWYTIGVWRFFVSVVLMFSMQKDIVTFSEQFNTNRKYSNILRIVKHNLT